MKAGINFDKSNYLQHIENYTEYLSFFMNQKIPFDGRKYQRIFVCGIGGSIISGMIVKDILGDKISIVNDRNLKATKKDLVVCVSYSGNTEETLECFGKAISIGSDIVVVASGGKLEELAQQKKLPILMLKKGMQPRASLPMSLAALLLICDPSTKKDLENAITTFSKNKDKLYQTGEMLGKKCVSKVPIFYSPKNLFSVAYRMKTQVNENVKRHAFCHYFPELLHNEIVAYTNRDDRFQPILITNRSNSKVEEVAKMMGAETLVVEGTHIEQAIKLSYIGDVMSYMMAKELNMDPTPVSIIGVVKEKELTKGF